MEDSRILIFASAFSLMVLHAMWSEENFSVNSREIDSEKYKYRLSIMKIILIPQTPCKGLRSFFKVHTLRTAGNTSHWDVICGSTV